MQLCLRSPFHSFLLPGMQRFPKRAQTLRTKIEREQWRCTCSVSASPGCKKFLRSMQSHVGRTANLVRIAHPGPTLAPSRLRGSVSPGSGLPRASRSARLKWQRAERALSLSVNAAFAGTSRPLLRFIRMWTLSKEPDTSDGMKALLSTEGVKKSQL